MFVVSLSEPLVSIVMPVYNGWPYVREAVDSVLSQQYSNFELCIVDNGSTDETSSWLETVSDARALIVSRQVTQAPADNWTQATQLARGSLVKLLCADDLLEPSAVGEQVAAMLQKPGVVMAASQRNIINSHGQVLKRNYGLGGLRGVVAGVDAIRACLRAGTNLLGEPMSVMFKTSALLGAMPWGGSSGYLTDLATYARVIQNATLLCLPGTVGSFRVSGGSWTTRVQQDQQGNFRRWRAEIVGAGLVPWTRRDSLVSSLNLAARTRARHWYLRKA